MPLTALVVLGASAGLYLGGAVVAQNAMQPYIDEFLNELEFLTGDASTKYGGLRVALGYAKPWTIRYVGLCCPGWVYSCAKANVRRVEIGNEDNLNGGSASYTAYRFPLFYSAIKAKYPNMTIIASFEARGLPAGAAQDYHVYDRPNRLVPSFSKFDKYDRKQKVLIGRYLLVVTGARIARGGGKRY